MEIYAKYLFVQVVFYLGSLKNINLHKNSVTDIAKFGTNTENLYKNYKVLRTYI